MLNVNTGWGWVREGAIFGIQNRNVPRRLGVPLGKNRGGRSEGSLDVGHSVWSYVGAESNDG